MLVGGKKVILLMSAQQYVKHFSALKHFEFAYSTQPRL